MGLKDYSYMELEEELERRDKEDLIKSIPVALENKNSYALQKICEKYVNDLAVDRYVDNDLEHYIFETAMEFIFGRSIWDWINEIE